MRPPRTTDIHESACPVRPQGPGSENLEHATEIACIPDAEIRLESGWKPACLSAGLEMRWRSRRRYGQLELSAGADPSARRDRQSGHGGVDLRVVPDRLNIRAIPNFARVPMARAPSRSKAGRQSEAMRMRRHSEGGGMQVQGPIAALFEQGTKPVVPALPCDGTQGSFACCPPRPASVAQSAGNLEEDWLASARIALGTPKPTSGSPILTDRPKFST